MQTRYIDGLTIRPLRNGDTGTVAALFDRLGSRSREKRFCGSKRRLSDNELTALARVDGKHHVLVGYLDGDPQPGHGRVGGRRQRRADEPTDARFLPPPIEPCMRFSLTRLTDVLHRRHSAWPATAGSAVER